MPPCGADRDPGGSRQGGVGPVTHAEHDQFRADGAGPGLHRLDMAVLRGGEGGHPLALVQRDADAAQCVGDQGAHIGIKGPHRLRSTVHQCHGEAAADEGFGHLQADVAGADHHRALRLLLPEPALQVHRVGQGLDAVHARRVGTGQRRPRRDCASSDDELVVGLSVILPGGPVVHGDSACVHVDRGHLAAHPQVNGLLVAEDRRLAGDEPVRAGHVARDQVRNAARRVGRVLALLEGDDLQVGGGAALAGLRGRGQAGRVAADDYQAFGRCWSRLRGGVGVARSGMSTLLAMVYPSR